jgi:hypothetical protein
VQEPAQWGKEKKVKLSLCCINQALRHEGVRESGGIDPLFIISVPGGGGWSVSRPLYSLGKNPWYPLDRRVSGPHRRSGRCGEKNSVLLLPGMEPWLPSA